MLNNSNYFVDIWFCYGSFFYGFEGVLKKIESNLLFVSVQTTTKTETKQIADFIETILNKSKGLIRIELRIYDNKNVKDNESNSFISRIFTETVPQIVDHSDCETAFKFYELFSANNTDRQKWECFCKTVDESIVV